MLNRRRIDIQAFLNSFIQPSKVLIVLLASCLFWAGGISLAVMWFAGTSVTTGWIVVGALVLAVLVWLAALLALAAPALAAETPVQWPKAWVV